MIDRDLPENGMSRDRLIAKHAELDELLQMHLGRRRPDDVQIRRLKCLKAMYRVRIDNLQPKLVAKESAKIINWPDGGVGGFAPPPQRPLGQPLAAAG